MSELEAAVVDRIRRAMLARNCRVINHHGSAYSRAGWPDLEVLVPRASRAAPKSPGPYTAFIEVKRPGERPTKIQLHHLQWLSDSGFRAGWAADVDRAMEIVFA